MSTAYLIKITAAVFAPLEAAALVLVCIWAYLNRPASIGLLWIGTCAVVAVLSVAFWGWITHGHPDPYRELDGVEADPDEHLKDLQQGGEAEATLTGDLRRMGFFLRHQHVDARRWSSSPARSSAAPSVTGSPASQQARSPPRCRLRPNRSQWPASPCGEESTARAPPPPRSPRHPLRLRHLRCPKW